MWVWILDFLVYPHLKNPNPHQKPDNFRETQSLFKSFKCHKNLFLIQVHLFSHVFSVDTGII